MSLGGRLRRYQHSLLQSRDRDYVSDGLQFAPAQGLFPHRVVADRLIISWPYFRKSIRHKWYADDRYPYIGFLNTDEAAILHSNAKLFAGKAALEVGCWRGWSAYQIAAAGLASLDVIDPVFSDENILKEVEGLLSTQACKSHLVNGVSPMEVHALIGQGLQWDFAFIDGDHEAPAPLNDVIACLPAMASTAMIMFHDLMSPDVTEGLHYLRDLGWNTKIYETSQIMGVAWRGDVTPVEHAPDPTQRWAMPSHIYGKDQSGPAFENLPAEDRPFLSIWAKCKPFTMTSFERGLGLFRAIRYIVENNIPGDFVECGVWRGGSSMIAMETLSFFRIDDRRILMFDTYAGMTTPGQEDVDKAGNTAQTMLSESGERADDVLCLASLADVRRNVALTGYPSKQIEFIEGDVTETLQSVKIEKIALLRLDTDFFDSTRAEMEVLYPKVVSRGILIIDDYGHWRGARKAVDTYFEDRKAEGFIPPILHWLDYTGKIGSC